MLNRVLLGLPFAFVALVLGVTTYVQGNWSERWNQAELNAQLKVASSKVDGVPIFIGDWKGTEQKVDPKQLEQAHVTAHQSREYLNVKNRNEKIGYFLVCGKPRHVAIHTPDDCYRAAGFQMLGKPEVVTIDVGNERARFYTTVFRKEQGSEVDTMRIFWAWNDGSGWDAPTSPRLAYGVGPSLYKMYCILPTADDRKVNDQHPCVKFIKSVLPEIDHSLFAKAIPSPAPVTETPAPAETPAVAPVTEANGD